MSRRYGRSRHLSRKNGRRLAYDRILIVCEGEKTEPNYFEDIRKKNRVPSAHVRVLPSEYGTQPRQIVDYAEAKFLENRAFEWIFAIFDRDSHATYHDALTRVSTLDRALRNDEHKSVRFVAIPSVPCFELWLLLHFHDQKAFCDRGEMLRRLKQYIPDHTKGKTGVFALTEPSFTTAEARAKWLQSQFNPFSGTEAYTNVNELVSLLLSLSVNR